MRVNLAKRAVGNRLVLRIVLVVQEELDDLPQGIILPLQFNIESILDCTYRRNDMILAAFDIADELRAFVNHNLRGLVDDFRVREDSHRLYHEIETVVLCEALRVEERPILALGFHLIATHGGYTFLHEFGFLDAPGFVDFRGVHRHLVGACANDIECTVFFGGANIEVACHRQSFAFAVFGHFREEAGELDEIAANGIRWEYFVDFHVSEVLTVGFVFEFEILCRDVADFAPVGDDVDF